MHNRTSEPERVRERQREREIYICRKRDRQRPGAREQESESKRERERERERGREVGRGGGCWTDRQINERTDKLPIHCITHSTDTINTQKGIAAN